MTNDLNPAGVDAAHEWWLWHGLTCCKNCGIVRRADGGNDTKPCKGVVPVGPRQLQSETGWLIELRGQRPSWWALIPDGEDGHSWTTDSLQALRFARQVDAEAYIEEAGWTEAFASEHQWSDPRPAASLPQPEGETADLVEQITALLELDAAGVLVPHGIGGLARHLLTASRDAITSLSQRLAVANAELTSYRDAAQNDGASHTTPEAQLAHAREAAIEECAKVADEHAETWGAAMASPAIVIAAAIRAMKGG